VHRQIREPPLAAEHGLQFRLRKPFRPSTASRGAHPATRRREERGGENPASRFPERRQYRDPLGDHGGDKIMRLFAQTATIENGFVHLPEASHWLPEYLAEFMLFPNACYDDQVDSTAQALAWAKQRPPANGMLECYGRLAEEAEG
jgi:hypothetical protein